MSSAVKHCALQYRKVLANTHLDKAIHDAFTALEEEIKKLRPIDQINLYSVASQFLGNLLCEPNNTINALEVFYLRCQSIVGTEHETLKAICLGLAAVAISLAVLGSCVASGVGIGMLMGIWQFPTAYLTSLLALETPALVVASASAGIAMLVGGGVGFSFFQPAKVNTAINRCIEVVKESHLTESHNEGEFARMDGQKADEPELVENRLQQ